MLRTQAYAYMLEMLALAAAKLYQPLCVRRLFDLGIFTDAGFG